MSALKKQKSNGFAFGDSFNGKSKGRYKLQCLGNNEISVEGCKGIMQYEPHEIRLNMGNGQIKIAGRELSIPVLDCNCVQIEGYVTNIELV